VEALGYRPVVARLLTVGGGETRSVNLTLNPAAPPVVTVDTVSLGGAASSRWRAGGVQLGGNDVDGLPSRFEDLATIASISTAFDGSLGSQGLPGEMTLVIVDGIPFYRAPHPSARAEFIPDGLFPRSTISGLTASHNGSDIEWSGAAGGYLGLATRSSTQDGGLELDGSYSGDPTWSSSELDLDTPSLLSYQGGLRGTVALSPNAQVVLSGEALRQQTPLTPRIDETLASDLVGLDPDLITSLSEAGVETYSRYSGMARFDVQRSRTSQIFFRGAGAYSVREFDGAGPLTLAGAASPAEESLDFSTALGVVSQSSRNVTLEFRAGVSGSYREFGASIAGVPPDAASAFGESSRTDFVMIPVVRYTPGATTLKFGATIRASNHTMAHSYASLGDFLYSDAGALLAGQGFGLRTSAPEESLGGRYDYEWIGGDGGSLNTDWFTATGLSTTDFKDGFHQFGANGTLVWDPTATGSTRVMISGSMREGDVDPRSLYQVFAEDTDGTATRFSGSGIDWPAGGIPPLAAPALPSFTLLGPDARAPRSTNLSASVTQRVAVVSTDRSIRTDP
jgi:hypothetical protein